jgi:hypothetical protein
MFKNYAGNNLHGCVNDAQDMVGVLTKLLGFSSTDITMLKDAEATKAAIMHELTAMVSDAKAGKCNYLVFSLSSHGTQVPDKNAEEPDHYDEAFCPHDLAASNGQWDPKHIIVDDELHDLFLQLPSSVLLEVYLDTCHSGTGLKAVDFQPDRRPRYLAPPSAAAFAQVESRLPRGLARRMSEKSTTHAVLTAACRANQTSADASIDGAYHGAFAYYWVKEILAAKNAVSRAELLKRVNHDLKAGEYSQVAQLECNATQRSLPSSPS